MAATPPICDFGWQAPDFVLPATDGKTYRRDGVHGEKGLLIMFICNHCPYVIGILDRLDSEMRALKNAGIGVAAICSNDAESYPDDSFENMVKLAEKQGFSFPYLHDEDQSVAKAYDAVCTPDFFGFNANLGLQYRGRLDSAGRFPATKDTDRDLFDAMMQVARTGQGPTDQVASMGCSIKWRV